MNKVKIPPHLEHVAALPYETQCSEIDLSSKLNNLKQFYATHFKEYGSCRLLAKFLGKTRQRVKSILLCRLQQHKPPTKGITVAG